MATRKTGETQSTGQGAAAGGKKAATKSTDGKATQGTAAKRTSSSRSGTKSGSSRSGTSRGGTKAGGSRSGAAKSPSKATLRKDLREFVEAHPGGWGHNEWIGLVNMLRDRGHDTGDTDAIGMALERERLTMVLERVPGLGAQRVKAIADKYPRIWNVMQAGAEEIAMAANLPRAVADKVKQALG